MEYFCKNCKFFESCIAPLFKFKIFKDFSKSRPCIDFEFKKCRYVLIHLYKESSYFSIVAFSDSLDALRSIMESQPRFGSTRHIFFICTNDFDSLLVDYPVYSFEYVFSHSLNEVKDICLINICKNVAQYLSIGEYAMLKKSYSKASAWFDKAKNSASLGADIIDNY